jgi:hypothetical protein
MPNKIQLPIKLSKRKERLLKIRERLAGIPAVLDPEKPFIATAWAGEIGQLRKKLNDAEMKLTEVNKALGILDQQIESGAADNTKFAPFPFEDDEDDIDVVKPDAKP